MLKIVIDDYKGEMKNRWKEMIAAGEWWFYFYILIWPPTMVCETLRDYGIFYSNFVPLIFAIFLSRMYPNRMSKTLLLCPLTTEEKRQYLKTGFQFRIALSLILFGVFNSILLIGRGVPVSYCLVMFIIFICSVISTNIYRRPKMKSSATSGRTYDLPGNYEFWNVLLIIVEMLGAFIVCSIQFEAEKGLNIFDKVVVVTILISSILICIVFVVKYYKPVMESGIQYEEIEIKTTNIK